MRVSNVSTINALNLNIIVLLWKKKRYIFLINQNYEPNNCKYNNIMDEIEKMLK